MIPSTTGKDHAMAKEEKFAQMQRESKNKFNRCIVAEMMQRGWQPPDGWTNEDSEGLGLYSFYGPVGDLMQMAEAGAPIEEQRAWIERNAAERARQERLTQ
jgi:hypothetical protein